MLTSGELSRTSGALSNQSPENRIASSVFDVRTKSLLTLGEDVFYVSECKGEGGFAKVFAASKQETEGGFCDLKFQSLIDHQERG